jgi:hypothetical protein
VTQARQRTLVAASLKPQGWDRPNYCREFVIKPESVNQA